MSVPTWLSFNVISVIPLPESNGAMFQNGFDLNYVNFVFIHLLCTKERDHNYVTITFRFSWGCMESEGSHLYHYITVRHPKMKISLMLDKVVATTI